MAEIEFIPDEPTATAPAQFIPDAAPLPEVKFVPDAPMGLREVDGKMVAAPVTEAVNAPDEGRGIVQRIVEGFKQGFGSEPSATRQAFTKPMGGLPPPAMMAPQAVPVATAIDALRGVGGAVGAGSGSWRASSRGWAWRRLMLTVSSEI